MAVFWRKTMLMIGITALLGGVYAEAYAPQRGNREPIEQRAERRRSPRRVPQRDQYFKDRIYAIVKVADLTSDEQKFVESELIKYDKVRLSSWQETQNIYKEMSNLGDKATDQQYRDNLTKLIQLNNDRHSARQKLTEALISKLGGKKAYLTYQSMNNYNSRVGIGLRE